MDALAEVFGSMKITPSIYTRFEMSAPWGLRSNRNEKSSLEFVVITRGACLLTLEKGKSLALAGGDVLIFLKRQAYTLTDQPGSDTHEFSELEKIRVDKKVVYGGGGAVTTLIRSTFEMDSFEAKPLLSVLPSFLCLRPDQNRTRAFQTVLDLLASETAEPGLASATVVRRMHEMLLIHAIRAFAQSNHPSGAGWLNALTDRQLGKAVKSMHSSLNENWTVEKLAEESGMSRSTFAARFKTIVGASPLEYLTQWRMYKAALLIRQNELSISKVANEVGYESESAFNRVFKREIGITPGEFRKKTPSPV